MHGKGTKIMYTAIFDGTVHELPSNLAVFAFGATISCKGSGGGWSLSGQAGARLITIARVTMGRLCVNNEHSEREGKGENSKDKAFSMNITDLVRKVILRFFFL